MPREVHGGEVGKLEVERTACRPAAVVGKLLQAQFVGPYLNAARIARIVAHANHDGAHLAERGVAHHADLVGGAVGIVFRIKLRVGDQPERLLPVAVALGGGKDGEVYVEHIFLRPHDARTGIGVGIKPVGGDFQGNFVFVEIILVVSAKAQEEAYLPVLHGRFAGEAVGVGEHLQVLVAAEVERCVLVDGACIVGGQLLHGDGQCLLVVLQHLVLPGVDDAADAGRYDVVDGLFLVVLLKAHGRGAHRAAHVGRLAGVEALVVGAPLGVHEVERGEAQHDGIFKVRHIHTHEANAREVGDAAHVLLVFLHGNAEQIPHRLLGNAVAGGDARDALVGDVVAAHVHCLGRDAHAVLVILFVFVEREVLVDILHVGRCLVGRAVTLGRVVGVYGVAVGIIYIFVSVENRKLPLVVVRAAEIMILVGRGGVVNILKGIGFYNSLHL